MSDSSPELAQAVLEHADPGRIDIVRLSGICSDSSVTADAIPPGASVSMGNPLPGPLATLPLGGRAVLSIGDATPRRVSDR